MKEEDADTKMEKMNYHLQEASRIEHEMAGAEEGEATIFGKMIYGIQLALKSIYGEEE